MLMEISVFIIALAFVVLVLYLVKTLKAAQGSLDRVSVTLEEVQKTVDELSYEVKQTIRHANGITADVEQKMKKIDPVITSVENLGEVLSELTSAAKQASATLMNRFQKPKQKDVASTAIVPPQPPVPESQPLPQDRVIGGEPRKAGPEWLTYVDIAAGVWQKMRR
ncbi:DUF948 domain-containing protein [Paenibacillus massiliensis]|uniref:DUF948 domain-containing protein n=1 Tax=Paenibacillus massiliensis TaxID=225917 RepID=UPI0004084A10|nr:DUF948 domain-containing protein [Paenibacillus massiliensis]